MAVSSDTLRLAIVKETVSGTTPTTPVFDLMRTVGEGLTYEVTTTQSDEMGGINRGVKDSILTGATVTGDINFELSRHVAFESLLAAGLGSDWGDGQFPPAWAGASMPADQIYDYSDLQSFTIEKRFTLDETPTYSYHRFTGCMVDTTNISITPNEPITGSFGFIGEALTTPSTEAAGATYQGSDTNPIMTAPLVTGIELLSPPGVDDADGLPLGSPVAWLAESCFTSLDITLANNGRGLQCIGFLGNKETVLGRFEPTASGALYYNGDEPLDALISQSEYALRVTMTDDDSESYTLLFPRVKFATASTLASGTNTDVMTEFTMNMLEWQGPDYAMSLIIDRSTAATPA